MYRFIGCLVAVVVLSGGVRYAARAGLGGKKTNVGLEPGESKILELTNEVRKEKKLPLLKVSPLLTEVARKHSANMAKQGKLEHVLDGKGTKERLKDAGYRSLAWGENIFFNRDFSGAAEQGFKWWMGSKHHRDNILQREFREIGIGLARDDKGHVYFTQVFGTPYKRR